MFVSYLVKHIAGKLNFEQTFYINGLIIFILYQGIENLCELDISYFIDINHYYVLILIKSIIFILGLFWQLIGACMYCFRSLFRGQEQQTLLLTGMLATLALSYFSSQDIEYYSSMAITVSESLIENYEYDKGEIEYLQNHSLVYYKGDIYLGLYADIREKLEKIEDLKYFLISSSGGASGESIRIHNYLKLKKLTLLSNYCMSACNAVFAAGDKRLSLPDAKFGFHMNEGFVLPDKQEDILVNEQLGLLKTVISDDSFLNKIYHTPNEKMYVPELSILKKNGYLTGILDHENLEKLFHFDKEN